MSIQELQNRDFRCYITAAGFNVEANAKQFGETVNIQWIQIGSGELPDGQSPVNRTSMVNSYGNAGRFPAKVYTDPVNPGGFVAECTITGDHAINGQGYVINEAAAVLDNGVLYAYRRVASDYKPVNQGEVKSYIIRLRFVPANAEVINITVDPTVVYATQDDLNRVMGEHVNAVDPHPQYGRKEKFYFSHHFQRIAILLVPYAEPTTRFDESFVTGRLTMARGSKHFSERLGDYEISVKSSYNQTSFTMMVYRRGWKLEFCVLEYEGQKWLALYDANAEWFNSQDAYVTFLGERDLKESSYNSNNQFKVISFASSQETTPATNPEVFETIVPLETHNPQDARGFQFFSQNYLPAVEHVTGLPEALTAKLPIDSLVGSIVEFSTDQPRAGYIKAQRVELSRLAYPKLWSVVQATSNLSDQALIDANPELYAGHYGTGDGLSTFTTPDYHLGHYRRGAEIDDEFASTLDSAVEYHNHGLPTSAANTATPVSYGMPDSAWVGVDHFNYVLPGGAIVVTADTGYAAAGQRKGNFDDVTRPKTLITHVYIYHGEAA